MWDSIGAARGEGVSESVAKAPRAGIDGGGKRGISTILFRRSGAIGAFATDSDNRRRRGPFGEGGRGSDDDHDGRPDDRTRPAGRPPGPRARHLTRENVPLADVLAGYPAISRVK